MHRGKTGGNEIRIAIFVLLFLLVSSVGIAETTSRVKQATIFGETITVGQGADIVQSRIKADKYVTSGNNYGDPSKGYYNDGGVTYIITYGPPKNGTGGYVVKQIEKVGKQEKPAVPSVSKPTATAPSLASPTRDTVIAARRKYRVQVVSFDASQKFGTEFPYSDYVRLRITNGSAVALSTLTVLTKRFDGAGRMIGSSRAPGIPVADLKPGQSAEVDYYPRGHLPGVKKITVEVEALISPEEAKFFKELP
jgi:hypothetical protein